jgi:hypothetical protein
MNVIPDNQARFTALRTGQVDVADNLPPSLIDTAENAGLVVHTLDVDARWIMILDRNRHRSQHSAIRRCAGRSGWPSIARDMSRLLPTATARRRAD